MLVKIIDSKYTKFETPEHQTIEGFKNLFINDFAGKFEIKSVFSKENLCSEEIEVAYSKKFDKFRIIKNNELDETEEIDATELF